jgi:hypothetical protein
VKWNFPAPNAALSLNRDEMFLNHALRNEFA